MKTTDFRNDHCKEVVEQGIEDWTRIRYLQELRTHLDT